MNRESKPFSWKKRAASFGFAAKGIVTFVRREHNAWIHLSVFSLVIFFGFFFHITTSEWIAVVLVSALVLAAEAFNTAIEYLCNVVSPEPHPIIGQVKDIAAGAVLITAIAAALVGLIIFVPYLLAL